MKFKDEVLDYLEGSSFSNGLIIDVTYGKKDSRDRFSLLADLTLNKKIIHLGCVDHLPLIQSKISNDTWLHSRLCKSSKRCLGIDINEEGVKFIKNLGYCDILHLDIIKEENEQIEKNYWDYIVLGEMLEHVDDPCSFLKILHKKYKNNIDKIIITVPNAFSLQNVKYTFLGKECINTDHRYWFTPYTLAKVLSNAGFKVDQFWFCNSTKVSVSGFKKYIKLKSLLKDTLLNRYPTLKNGIVMIAEF